VGSAFRVITEGLAFRFHRRDAEGAEIFSSSEFLRGEIRTNNLNAAANKTSTVLRTAAGGGVLAFDPGLNYIGGTPDPRGHGDRFSGAVLGTGTALHAPV
jgi:hypothetical protein